MGFSVEFSNGTKKKNFHIAGQADVIAKYNEGYEKGLNAGYENGVVDGRTAEQSDFWDNFQDYGNRTHYSYAFWGRSWNDTTFRPKYNLSPQYAQQMFYDCYVPNLKQKLLDLNIVLDTSNASGIDHIFYSCESTELPVISTIRASALMGIFGYAANLKTIEKLILKNDGSQQFSVAFQQTTALENLVIEGVIGQNGFNVSWSTKLTHDSLMSILNTLQDKSTDTSGTIWTVTIGATNIAKLTDAELQIAYDKGWVVA